MNAIPKNEYELNQTLFNQGIKQREKATFEKCAEIMEMTWLSPEERRALLAKLEF
jgi:hypothetical protein